MLYINPNFVPHFGFFHKMSQADVFILLTHAQFEKNGYQNRYFIQRAQKWVTKPVESGLDPIHAKYYTDGSPLMDINIPFIHWVANVLDIDTQIVMDIPTNSRGTQRLIDNINYYGGTAYITRSDKDKPEADRYLDEKMFKEAGIDIEYCSTPNEMKNILEMFEEFGIESTKKQLFKKKEPIKNDIS